VFLLRLAAPVYAEPASGLREDTALAPLLVSSGERLLRNAAYDAVLRLGGVPAVRLWRDLEARDEIPICSVSRTPFRGLPRGDFVHAAPGATLARISASGSHQDAGWRDDLLVRDRARRAALRRLLLTEPAAEPSLIHALSGRVPEDAFVYLGNSLPVREWDLAAERVPRDWEIGVSRGANGIDGQLATFFGMCGPEREHWAVVGDLTALYDAAAPWILDQLDTGPIRIVIVNNRGGQIFARLSPHVELRNQHSLSFYHWAALWRLPHLLWDAVPATMDLPERCVIELRPDAAATERFWRAYDALP